MNKYEIETEILKELKTFLPKIKEVPFDKALPLLQREAWRLADKYDTDGANVINIMMKRFRKIAKEQCKKGTGTYYCKRRLSITTATTILP